jgi:hypothetical protein
LSNVCVQATTRWREELSAALGAGDADQGETPCSIRPTDVPEAQKLKRLWPLSVLESFDGRTTPKEQQPSFLLGQFAIELRKTFPQLAPEVLRVSKRIKYALPWHCALNFFQTTGRA